MNTRKSLLLTVIGTCALAFMFYVGFQISKLRFGSRKNVPTEISQRHNLPTDPNKIETLQVDGTRIVWIQKGDKNFAGRINLFKYTYPPGEPWASKAEYRFDSNNNPLSCKIYDHQGDLIYKGQYGYRKTDGKLAEERFFACKNKPLNRDTNSQIPVRRTVYEYDVKGNRLKPTVVYATDASSQQGVPTGLPESWFENPFAKPKDS